MVLKLVVGLFMGSVSVVSEAIHSGIDLAAALIAFYSVQHSDKPPDQAHPYGHGKIENVSGVIEALLIFAAAIWIIAEAVLKIEHGGAVASLGWGFAVMAVSAGVNWGISIVMFRAAKKTDSIALQADALHHFTDVYTSAGVAAGIALLKLTGIQLLDPIVAILVSLLIIKAAYDLTRDAFSPLLDAELPAGEAAALRDAINEFRGEFVGYHRLRARRSGSDRHIDLHLVVHRDRRIGEVHALCDAIEARIRELMPRATIVIHTEPCDDSCRVCQSPVARRAAGGGGDNL